MTSKTPSPGEISNPSAPAPPISTRRRREQIGRVLENWLAANQATPSSCCIALI
uniref:Uncharacterized protein n=1 Tax=Phenylobacterium glaciei TaxID=2803784 RepID=A0A974P658_9CAUL|nr:hypothetical protein JKL49_12750 [Phenylobacterium glaciei]